MTLLVGQRESGHLPKARAAGVEGLEDALGDLPQLTLLGPGQRVEDQAADFVDVAGGAGDDPGPAVTGERDEAGTAVGRVDRAADPAAILKLANNIGQPGQGAGGVV